MRVTKVIGLLAAVGLLAGCENMSTGGKGAVAGGAIGTGIGLATGGTFGQVVGGGLIGAGAGYILGTAADRNK